MSPQPSMNLKGSTCRQERKSLENRFPRENKTLEIISIRYVNADNERVNKEKSGCVTGNDLARCFNPLSVENPRS